MAHRKWKEAKQLPGTAGPGNILGCCLISSHFLWAIHPIRPVYAEVFFGAMKEREAESGAEAKNNPVSADLDPVPLSLLKYLPC